MAGHDLNEMLAGIGNTKVNRRGFLYASGLSASAAFLAACGPGGASSAPSVGASAAPSAAASEAASADTGAQPSYATEGALFMYNWADYVDPDNIEEFKARYNLSEFTYDIYPSNEELLTRLQGGATSLYDIACPTCEFVPTMADQDFIVPLDFSRIPNAKFINPTFQNFFDPAGPQAKYNGYQIPKDWGTTGISIRTKVVTEEVKTWKQFFEVAPKYSGRIVAVNSAGDVLTAPLKALGYSLNSVDPTELNAARELLRGLAPHVLVLDSDTYQDKLRTEEAVLGLTWTGGIDELKAEPETADTVYNVPQDGTLYWMDSWVLLKDAPHPETAYAWLNFIHEPAIQARETETNYYATPNDEAKKLVDPELLANPTVFVPDEAFASLEGANDVSTDPLRIEIWEEFVSSVGG
ncbi:MAG: spermidine/putrescine ABC transporter substrate-binding protein [Candidatus Limnocylindrales bacterium]